MTGQVTQVLGLSDFEAEAQTRRASQNLQAVRQASTVLVRGAQEVSQEWFGLVQEQLTKRVEGLNRMAGCRSVRAFVAAQSELMRDNTNPHRGSCIGPVAEADGHDAHRFENSRMS